MPTSLLGSPYGGLGHQILAAPFPMVNDIVMALPHLELYYWFEELDGPEWPNAVDYSGNNRDAAVHGTPTRPAFRVGISPLAVQLNTATDYFVQTGGTAINISEGTIALFYRGLDGAVPPDAGTLGLIFGLTDGTRHDKVLFLDNAGSLTFGVRGATGVYATVTTPPGFLKLDRWMLLTATFIGGTATLTVNDPTDAYYFHGTAPYTAPTRTDFTAPNVRVGGGWDGPDFFAGVPFVTTPGYYDELYVRKYVAADPPATTPVWASGLSVLLDAPLLTTYVVGEAIRTGVAAPAGRTTQLAGEVLRDSGITVRKGRVTQVVMEVLRSSAVGVNHPAVQTLVFTQTAVGTNRPPVVHAASVSQTWAFTQSAKRNRVGSIAQSLAFTQSASIYIHAAPAPQSLVFTQTASQTVVRDRHVLQLLAFTQSVVNAHDANIDGAQALVFTQTATLGRFRTGQALHLLSFTETAAGHVEHPVAQVLAFTQAVGVQLRRSRAVTQTWSFTQAATLNRGTQAAAFHAWTFTQVATCNGPFASNPVSGVLADPALGDFILADTGDESVGVDQLVFNQTVVVNRVIHRSVTQRWDFHETVPRVPRLIVRAASDTWAFLEGGVPADLADLVIDGRAASYTLPVARIVRVVPAVVLRSSRLAIVLPAPEFSDTEGSYDKVNVRRTMFGGYYSYVQTSKVRTLEYHFVLGRKKALELRNFVKGNLSEVLHLTDWKGHTYLGQVTTNPAQFGSEARYARDTERVSVTLAFEGVRV